MALRKIHPKFTSGRLDKSFKDLKWYEVLNTNAILIKKT